MTIDREPSQLTNPERPAAVKAEIQAKQGTDKPRGMPVVLVVGIVGAIAAMGLAWAYLS